MKTQYQKEVAICYSVLAKSFKGAIMNTEAVMMVFSSQGGITTQPFTQFSVGAAKIENEARVLHPSLIKGKCFNMMREFCSWTICHTRPLGMPTLHCFKFKEAIKKVH
jgi:hypothetical protein